MKTIKNILLVLGTGYVFVYFSEHLFWARVRPDDSLKGWVGAWVAYSLVAYVFLLLITQFNVKSIWPLFLAGAAVGWLTEGLIVQTTYESLPFSISFTGLAWHALITVWIGWYAVQRSFHPAASFSTWKLAALIGACSALWAINWWLEPDGGVASIAEYSSFSFITSMLVIIAYWVINWAASEPFRPKRWVTFLIAAVFLLYFAFVTVPSVPIALIILPMLLGVIYFGLWRSSKGEDNSSLLVQFAGQIEAKRILGLFVLPIVNITAYVLALTLNINIHSNWVLYLITMPLGFILLFVSLYKISRT